MWYFLHFTSGALVVEGSLSLESDVLGGGIKISAEAEAFIDFISDVDFSDKIKLCLQMRRPDVKFR